VRNRLFVYLFQCFFPGEKGDLLFQALNSGEELENHEKDEKEAGEDNGIDVALDADDVGQKIADIGENGYGCHAAPYDKSDGKFPQCLAILTFEKLLATLVDHESGHEYDDDLVDVDI
jgi:choline dehydrogenase-like flavoprotein